MEGITPNTWSSAHVVSSSRLSIEVVRLTARAAGCHCPVAFKCGGKQDEVKGGGPLLTDTITTPPPHPPAFAIIATAIGITATTITTINANTNTNTTTT